MEYDTGNGASDRGEGVDFTSENRTKKIVATVLYCTIVKLYIVYVAVQLKREKSLKIIKRHRRC